MTDGRTGGGGGGGNDDDEEKKSTVLRKHSFRCSRNVLCLSATYFFNKTFILFPAQHTYSMVQRPS